MTPHDNYVYVASISIVTSFSTLPEVSCFKQRTLQSPDATYNTKLLQDTYMYGKQATY